MPEKGLTIPASCGIIPVSEKGGEIRYEDGVLYLENLPEESLDPILHFAVFALDFGEEMPRYSPVPPNLAEFMNV